MDGLFEKANRVHKAKTQNTNIENFNAKEHEKATKVFSDACKCMALENATYYEKHGFNIDHRFN